MAIDLYEREVKVIMENGGIERLKKQYMILSKHLDNIYDENKELKKQISELESELSVKEELLKIKNAYSDKDWEKDLKAMVDFGIHIDEETLKKFAELGKEGKVLEEPLPFSDEQYEEDKIAELEERISKIENFIQEQTEAEIKRLKAENKYMQSQIMQSEFVKGVIKS